MKLKTSICDLSLSDAFISRVKNDVQKVISSQKILDGGTLGVQVLPIHTDRQIFIEGYLQNLYVSKQGIFCKQRTFVNKRKNNFIYDCERSCFSKGSSTGDPTRTRANGCKAFVSFTFEDGATINLCIIKYRLVHSGHNPANRDECKVNRIDPTLKEEIQSWISETTKISEILLKVSKWNKIHENADYKDRRFFPSPQDIQQFIWMSHKVKPYSDMFGKAIKRQDAAASSTDLLASLLKTKHKDMCVFYQPANANVTDPKSMILVLQTQHQKEKYETHGHNLLFISKNFEGMRCYGNVIYSLVVRDDDVAYPIAYIVSNSDDSKSFIQGLLKFTNNNMTVKPKAFFVDKDLIPCSEAIVSLYPDSRILVPKYQVMKSVHEWLMQSAVSEKSHRDVREVLLKYMLDLSNCGTEDEFLMGTSELEQKVDYPEFTQMLQKDWLVCGNKWCDFGRSHLFTSTHNSFLVEKLFLNLEHQLLNCLQTLYKPEDLVEHIAKDLNQNKGDGLIDMEDFLEGTPEEQAENLLQDGWGRLVLWPAPFEAFIPNQSNTDLFYKVKLITMECECPFPPYRGQCVHLNLALMLVEKKVKEEGAESVEAARIRISSEADDNRDYLPERLSLTTFHSGIICVTSLSDLSCTCKASFFGYECVGVVLCRLLNPNLTVTEPVPKPTIEYPKQPQTASSKDLRISDPETINAVNSLHSLSNQNQVNNVHRVETYHHSDKSSKKLIEDLFMWSQSPAFTDSPALQNLLTNIHVENQIILIDEIISKQRSPKTKNVQKRNRSRTPIRESPRKSNRTKHH